MTVKGKERDGSQGQNEFEREMEGIRCSELEIVMD